jgi:polysaccharide biosynthesis transport protein
MTAAQIFILLRARWRFAVLVLLAVVALTAAISLLRTPQYTATASVVLDVKSPDPIAGVVLPGLTTVGYMATQMGVLQSERVALGAIRRLKLDKDPDYQQKWREATDGRGDFNSWLSERLLRKLDASPGRDSNVIMVGYTAPDPVFAAAVANAFVESYIETTLELRTEPAKQYTSLFDSRGKQLREELERAQQKLSEYQQKNGVIVASEERLDVENQRLQELTSQLVLMQGLATESGSRQGQSVARPEKMPEVVTNPLLIGLNTEMSKQESRLHELTERLGDNHPDVVELRSNITQLRKRIDEETRRVAGSLTVTNDVNQTRLAQARQAVADQRAKLLQLKTQRDEAAVLQRDVENAQRSYDAVQTRANQSSVESQASQTNVSVLKHATTPALPSSPKLVLNLTVAVLVGLLLAVAAAVLREKSDQRLRTEHDVVQLLKQPLLGVMTSHKHTKRTVSPYRLRWMAHLARVLPPPAAKG